MSWAWPKVGLELLNITKQAKYSTEDFFARQIPFPIGICNGCQLVYGIGID